MKKVTGAKNNTMMTSRRFMVKLSVIGLLLGLVIVGVALGSCIHTASRAKDFLREVQELRPGASSFEEVARLAREFAPYVQADESNCGPQACTFTVRVHNANHRPVYVVSPSGIYITDSTADRGYRRVANSPGDLKKECKKRGF